MLPHSSVHRPAPGGAGTGPGTPVAVREMRRSAARIDKPPRYARGGRSCEERKFRSGPGSSRPGHLIAILRGSSLRTLGRVSVSTPFSRAAEVLSSRTALGSAILRLTEPNRRSLR